MKDYLKQFVSVVNYNTWKISKNYIKPNVSLIESKDIVYNPIVNQDSSGSENNDLHDYSQDYLTCTVNTPASFYVYDNLSYSLDEGETWTAASSNDEIIVTNKVLLKCTTPYDPTASNDEGSKSGSVSSFTLPSFSTDAYFNVDGNIMSLVYGDDFINNTTLYNNIFYYYFGGKNIISAENLILPATTLKEACYQSMFKGCTSLTTAPELPATTLEVACYHSMFQGCTSLTTAPKLPATTLANYCYSGMFSGCISLTTASELPATTLAEDCYSYMFQGCTSLTSASKLPATTLANNCYSYMFSYCTNLNYVKALFTTTPGGSYTYNWLYNVAAIGTFFKNFAATWDVSGESGVPNGWTITLNEFGLKYLTTEALESGTIGFTIKPGVSTSDVTSISYRKNGGEWITTTNENNVQKNISVSVVNGDKIEWKGYAIRLSNNNGSSGYSNFNSTCNFNVYGNSMSLLYGDNFVDKTTLLSGLTLTFHKLFYNCAKLISANNFILPATTLTNLCYKSMFEGCISLITGPELPAITLASSCYNSMFWGCSSLATAPELPATVLVNGCYYNMFAYCTSLTATPELPATILADACYEDMFHGCTSLTTISELPATTLAIYCYNEMFNGCASLTTTPELPATTLENYCYRYMFAGCTSLTTTPKLPATSLASYCYYSMFQGCTSLTSAPELPTTSLASYCYDSMFRGCTSLTTAPELPATRLANYCYNMMFYGCTSLTTAPELPATTLVANCYSYMFKGCTSLTTAPKLPATTLTRYCYAYMFSDCTNLNYVKALFTTNPSTSSYTSNWLNNVSATGIFIKNPNATWNVSGASGVPSGWTIVTSEFSLKYLTTEAKQSGTIGFTIGSGVSTSDITSISYRKNEGDWITTTNENNVQKDISVSVVNGDKIEWKGTAIRLSTGYLVYSNFNSTCNFNVYGNSMSLLYGDDFNKTTFPSSLTYTFGYLFNGCTKLISTENLMLPATTLTIYCYYSMFYGCTSLTTVPELPAITLLDHCYTGMFNGCTSLTIAPELPAITLKNGCYQLMFNGCTSLTTAPELPATTLASYCYADMFYGCTSLTTAPELPATTLAERCYHEMFRGCTSLTTVPKLPATTLAINCYSYMFTGCTSLTTAPELPATTLVSNCYRYMFYGCTTLNYVKALFTTTPGSSYTYNWLSNVATTGAFIKNPNATWNVSGSSGVPSGWTIVTSEFSLKYLTTEAKQSGTIGFTIRSGVSTADVASISYRKNGGDWITTANENNIQKDISVSVVNGDKIEWKGTAIRLSTRTVVYSNFTSTCNFKVYGNVMSLLWGDNFAVKTTFSSGITYIFGCLFNGCTKLISAENLILPATTLANSCYNNMFYNCTSLTTAPELPATTLTDYCYASMFNGCTSLTTAPELPATILANSCYSCMFQDCTLLTTAPELPATALASSCYEYMFYDCSSLATGPELPATTLAQSCYKGMFSGCISLTTAPELPATSLARYCYQEMFSGCTSLTTAPELPATTLASNCYQQMFISCTSLTSAPELPATELVEGCYIEMFCGCTNLNYVKAMFLDYDSTYNQFVYNNSWLEGVSSSGTFIKNHEAIWDDPDNIIVPEGWNIQMDNYSPSTTQLTMWIDDFICPDYEKNLESLVEEAGYDPTDEEEIQAYFEEIVDDPYSIDSPPNEYCYLNETFEYEGKTYYLWEDANTGEMYMLTDTIDVQELYSHSIAANYTNRWCPYVVRLDSDMELQYIGGEINQINDVLVTVIDNRNNNGNLSLFIDDYEQGILNLDQRAIYSGYNNAQEYMDYVLNDPADAGANRYDYTGETFDYDGETYYLWEYYDIGAGNSNKYLLTDTIDGNYLYQHSMEADITNTYCPYIALLDEDKEVTYLGTERDDWLIKVEGDNIGSTHLVMIVDEFNCDIEDLMDEDHFNGTKEEYIEAIIEDPEQYGSKTYEHFGETFEYDGETYYIWELKDDDSYYEAKAYMLTTTNDYSTLNALSLESDINNTIFNDYILLRADLETEYNPHSQFYIISVRNLSSNVSCDYPTLWVDAFPEGLQYYADDEGYDTVNEYLQAIFALEGLCGARKYNYTGITLTYNNSTYYVWEFEPTHYINFGSNNVHINQFGSSNAVYMLTDTINVSTLHLQSLQYNSQSTYHPVSFLIADLETEYNNANDSYILKVETSNTAYIAMYIDDYIDEGSDIYNLTDRASEEGYQSAQTYIDTLIDNNCIGANKYVYTGQTFIYNGTTYYLWTMVCTGAFSEMVMYLLTDTIDVQELYDNSLEADVMNEYCPYVSILESDKETEYRDNTSNDWLLKVESPLLNE